MTRQAPPSSRLRRLAPDVKRVEHIDNASTAAVLPATGTPLAEASSRAGCSLRTALWAARSLLNKG